MVETEESFTYTEFRDAFAKKWNLWRKRKVDTPVIIGTYSDGTRFFWEDELGDRHYGVISNLSSFSIARAGVASITIPLNTASTTITVTISPALNDAVLGNWLLYALQENPIAVVNVVTISAKLASTTSMTLRATHLLNSATAVQPGLIDALDQYPTDTQVDVGLGHTHLLGTITNSTHTHVMSFAGAATTFNVFWMIVHK